MNPLQHRIATLTRRSVLKRGIMGLGATALSTMLPNQSTQGMNQDAAESIVKQAMTHAPKAKRAIFLFMAGAPSQQDMLDYKPLLKEKFRVDLRKEKFEDGSLVLKNRVTTMTSGQSAFPIAPTKFKFAQHGQSGAWFSELLPHTAKMADDLCIIKSMWTDAINHDPAITLMNTGNQLPGKPSLGAWLSYGLGSLNDNLPTFMVMTPSWTGRQDAQALYNRLWGSTFLPSEHQGVPLRTGSDPVLYLSNPSGMSSADRRRTLDALANLNAQHHEQVGDPDTEARIAQYEMAFRMQTSVPDLVDTSTESKKTLEMYGPDVAKPGTFAASCLLARRMAERDVRFVQIFHRGWDQHGDISGMLPRQCNDVDQPSWALVQDLKQRGLLEDTLVIWGGEFGRTSYCQGSLTNENYGRDHHPACFTIWMAGGGVKAGITIGETDDYGVNIIDENGQPTTSFDDNAFHTRDLNATILNQFGIDHNKLVFPYRGLDEKLTSVQQAHVMEKVLAD
jgi:hypothetical protein